MILLPENDIMYIDNLTQYVMQYMYVAVLYVTLMIQSFTLYG